MFAVGHLALGYITGKAASLLLKTRLHVSLLFLFSVLPDIDLIIPAIPHRGPTHSLLVCFAFSLPFFIAYRKEAVPYFVAGVQHLLLGDFLTGGGAEIFWPFSTHSYGLQIHLLSLTNICLEWAFFTLSLAWMLKTRDVAVLFQHHKANLLLTVPAFTILSPIAFKFPLDIPIALLAPHLIYLTLFSASVLIDIKYVIKSFQFWHKL